MTDVTGGCLCGRVRYPATGEPVASLICHCCDCHHFTGSAFSAGVIFPAGSVSIKGELKAVDVVGKSGKAVSRYFCPNCGSGIAGRAEIRPGKMIILAGTFDHPSTFEPKVEVCCDSAQPWVHAEAERPGFAKALQA